MNPEIQKQPLGGSRPINRPLAPQEKKPMPAPTPKDVFGKSGYISPDRARQTLRDSKNMLYGKYGLKGTDVDRLGATLTNPKFGSLTNARDIEKYVSDRKKEIYKMPNLAERDKAMRMLDKEKRGLKDVFGQK